jgi:hypothetical protein
MSDSLAPREIVAKLIDMDAAKSQHGIPDLLVRGSLSGVLLVLGPVLYSAMSFGEAPLTGRLP